LKIHKQIKRQIQIIKKIKLIKISNYQQLPKVSIHSAASISKKSSETITHTHIQPVGIKRDEGTHEGDGPA